MDNYEYLRNIRIPEAIYSSARGNLSKGQRPLRGMDGSDGCLSDMDQSPASPSWPSSGPYGSYHDDDHRPLSSSSSSSTTTMPHSPVAYRYSSNPRSQDGAPALPRLSSIAPVNRFPPHRNLSPPAPSSGPYSPLTSEDRRALNSFRVVL